MYRVQYVNVMFFSCFILFYFLLVLWAKKESHGHKAYAHRDRILHFRDSIRWFSVFYCYDGILLHRLKCQPCAFEHTLQPCKCTGMAWSLLIREEVVRRWIKVQIALTVRAHSCNTSKQFDINAHAHALPRNGHKYTTILTLTPSIFVSWMLC